MNARKNLYYFYKKKSNIDKRLNAEFLDNGIATIPCKVNSYDDVISNYSIKNYETLNPAFREYIDSIVATIPVKYPIVLNIVGCEFTEQEQEIIKETIEADYSYTLGLIEKELKYHLKTFIFMTIGFIITAILVFGFSGWGGFTKELLFVVFWFFADTFIRYIFNGTYELNMKKTTAGRIACVQVGFSKEYSERQYTKEEVEKIIKGLDS